MNKLDKPRVEHIYRRMYQNGTVNVYLNGQLTEIEPNRTVNDYLHGQLIENRHEKQQLLDTLSRKLAGYAYYVFQKKGWYAKSTPGNILMAHVDGIKALILSNTTRDREYSVTFLVKLPPVRKRAQTFETISYKKLPETVDFGKLFMEQFLQNLEPLNELDNDKLEKTVDELNSKPERKLILEVFPKLA